MFPAVHTQLDMVIAVLVAKDAVGQWARAAGTREWALLQWCHLMSSMVLLTHSANLAISHSSQMARQAAAALTVAAFKAVLGLLQHSLAAGQEEGKAVVRSLHWITGGFGSSSDEDSSNERMHMLMAKMLLSCQGFMEAVQARMAASLGKHDPMLHYLL